MRERIKRCMLDLCEMSLNETSACISLGLRSFERCSINDFSTNINQHDFSAHNTIISVPLSIMNALTASTECELFNGMLCTCSTKQLIRVYIDGLRNLIMPAFYQCTFNGFSSNIKCDDKVSLRK